MIKHLLINLLVIPQYQQIPLISPFFLSFLVGDSSAFSSSRGYPHSNNLYNDFSSNKVATFNRIRTSSTTILSNQYSDHNTNARSESTTSPRSRRTQNDSSRRRNSSYSPVVKFDNPKTANTKNHFSKQKRNQPFHKNDASTNKNNNIVIPEIINEQRKSSSISCPHFDICSGCTASAYLASVPIIQSSKLYFSSISAFQNNNNSNFQYQTVIPSSITQWRTQAKLVVGSPSSSDNSKPTARTTTWRKDGCTFGLYQHKSHTVIPIPECSVHHPSINYAVELLIQATKKTNTPPYNEITHEGGLRYVQLSVERSTQKVSLTLIWFGSTLKDCQPNLSRLIKELKKLDTNNTLWHSIWCHTNDNYGNVIFSRGEKNWHLMDGLEFVREPIPGTLASKNLLGTNLEYEDIYNNDYDEQINDDNDDTNKSTKDGLLYFTPMTFRQGNLDGFDAIAQHVAREIPGGSKVCELYAGVGVLGLTGLTYHAKLSQNDSNHEPLQWLRCSDENPSNPRCFYKSLNSIPVEVTGRTKKVTKRYNKKDGGQSNHEITMEDIMQGMMNGNSYNPSDPGPKGKVSYLVASAAKALHEGQALGADVLIVDPPRKGLEDEVLVQLCKPHNPNQEYTEDPLFIQGPRYSINWVNDVNTLIYVSCGFDALARDCDRLLKGNAGWKIESATGYILFPGTNHVETVVIFKRRAGRT